MNMNIEQLELILNQTQATPVGHSRKSNRTRAAWWFAQMRRIVDQAIAWQPAPPARPEQIWLPDDRRQPQL
jgi:hypothetical protein